MLFTMMMSHAGSKGTAGALASFPEGELGFVTGRMLGVIQAYLGLSHVKSRVEA